MTQQQTIFDKQETDKKGYCNNCGNGILRHHTGFLQPYAAKTKIHQELETELTICYCCGTVYKKDAPEEREETVYSDRLMIERLEEYKKGQFYKLMPFTTLLAHYFYRKSRTRLEQFNKTLIYTDVNLFYNFILGNLASVFSAKGQVYTFGETSGFEIPKHFAEIRNISAQDKPSIFIYLTDVFTDNNKMVNAWNPNEYAVFCIKNESTKHKGLAMPLIYSVI